MAKLLTGHFSMVATATSGDSSSYIQNPCTLNGPVTGYILLRLVLKTIPPFSIWHMVCFLAT